MPTGWGTRAVTASVLAPRSWRVGIAARLRLLDAEARAEFADTAVRGGSAPVSPPVAGDADPAHADPAGEDPADADLPALALRFAATLGELRARDRVPDPTPVRMHAALDRLRSEPTSAEVVAAAPARRAGSTGRWCRGWTDRPGSRRPCTSGAPAAGPAPAWARPSAGRGSGWSPRCRRPRPSAGARRCWCSTRSPTHGPSGRSSSDRGPGPTSSRPSWSTRR